MREEITWITLKEIGEKVSLDYKILPPETLDKPAVHRQQLE